MAISSSNGTSIIFTCTQYSIFLDKAYLNGLVHSYYKYGILITSPNMDYIPEFPEVDEKGIYLRGDGFYGPQEFTHWPQIYTHSLCHYCAIPAKPTNITQQYWGSILFRQFTKKDWTPVSPLPPGNSDNWSILEYAGGFLSKILLQRLKTAFEDAVTTCLLDHEQDKAKPYTLARALRNLGRCALKRLHDVPDCASQVIFEVRDIQRIGLELHGIHEWMTAIRSRLTSRSHFPPGQYLGCFTLKLAEAQMLYHAGIPVWLIQTKSSITAFISIGNQIEDKPVSSELELTPWQCMDGSYLYSKDIKDGGRLRDCTGLVYDAALSDMMEDVKSYLLNALNNRTGGMDPSAEVHTNNAPQKRKAGRSDL